MGEKIAEKFLTDNGYKIVERNVWQKFGEIDIVAKDKKGAIHFVEVKTISVSSSENSGIEPEDNLNPVKLLKMKKIAEWYANQKPKIVISNYQLDLVAIKLLIGESPEIKFYTNIF